MNGSPAPARAPEHQPDAETLRRPLADAGDALRDALHDLHARPSLETANAALRQLTGARGAVLAYREAMKREDDADGSEAQR